MKIETLKKLIELEAERNIDVNRFKDSVIQLIDLYESDREIPSYPIGVPNTTPPRPYPFIPPPFSDPSFQFPPTYIYPNGTPPTNLCGSASSPSINPNITTSNYGGEVVNTLGSSEFLRQCSRFCNVTCFCPDGVCKNFERTAFK